MSEVIRRIETLRRRRDTALTELHAVEAKLSECPKTDPSRPALIENKGSALAEYKKLKEDLKILCSHRGRARASRRDLLEAKNNGNRNSHLLAELRGEEARRQMQKVYVMLSEMLSEYLQDERTLEPNELLTIESFVAFMDETQ